MPVPLQIASSNHQPLTPFLSDKDLASILRMKLPWVRSHAQEIPGLVRFDAMYRFTRRSVESWLGSLEPLLLAGELAALVHTTPKWIYDNAESLAGFIQLGRYVRFRPSEVRALLDGTPSDDTEVVQ
jgi:hypothetical protein